MGNKHEEFHIVEINQEKLLEIEKAREYIIEIGRKIKAFRESGNYSCPKELARGEGCLACRNFEKVYQYIQNKEKSNTVDIFINIENERNNDEQVEYVGVSDYNQDMYYLK